MSQSLCNFLFSQLSVSLCMKFYEHTCAINRPSPAGLQDQFMRQVEWESSKVSELDLTSTELSSECLMDILTRMNGFTYLGLGYCEFFNDKVINHNSHPLGTISTSLWASLHHHLPVLSVFIHVSCHFIFFISSRVLSSHLRLGRPFLHFSGAMIFLERFSSLLLMCHKL